MSIQRLKGNKKPGDESASSRPQTNATDENAYPSTHRSPSHWDELSVAEKSMNEIPLREVKK